MGIALAQAKAEREMALSEMKSSLESAAAADKAAALAELKQASAAAAKQQHDDAKAALAEQKLFLETSAATNLAAALSEQKAILEKGFGDDSRQNVAETEQRLMQRFKVTHAELHLQAVDTQPVELAVGISLRRLPPLLTL